MRIAVCTEPAACAAWLGASAVGLAGIYFVLAGEATAGLEKKQREKYGGSPEYEAWVASSWSGPMLAAPPAPPAEPPSESE